MNLKSIVQNVAASRDRGVLHWAQPLTITLLLSFCSCATTSQATRSSPAHAAGGPSAGTRAGESVATGLRYVFGFPFVTLQHLIPGADHWGDFSSGYQKVRDYQPGQPPETGDSVLRNETIFR